MSRISRQPTQPSQIGLRKTDEVSTNNQLEQTDRLPSLKSPNPSRTQIEAIRAHATSRTAEAKLQRELLRTELEKKVDDGNVEAKDANASVNSSGHGSVRFDMLLSQTSVEHLKGAVTCATDRLQLGKQALDSADLLQDVERRFPEVSQASKIKIAMLSMQIVMGDICDPLRSAASVQDPAVVLEFESIAKNRDLILSAFSKVNDAETSRQSQDRASKYTQFVQMSTQPMKELQNTERELIDALQSMHRNMQTFWESYAGFRDQEYRTNSRVKTLR